MCNKYFKNSLIPETKANLAAMLEDPTWFFLKKKIVINITNEEKEGDCHILQMYSWVLEP